MIWQMLQGRDVTPKYIICGCPKHGLHLATGLIHGYVKPVPDSIYNTNHWIGTYKLNSFIPIWQEMDRWFFLASRLQQGYYYQGHVVYREDIANFLKLARVSFVLIYRDLRDVAISMAHHILNDDDDMSRHPAKNAYRALGGFDEVLSACIVGLGAFPGVVGLWEDYAPWLDEDWVHCIKFEDTLADLEGTAAGMIGYGLDRITRDIWESKFVVEQSVVDMFVKQMVAIAERKDLSPTFRKGQPGEWKEVFKPEHKDLFKTVDNNGWLKKLGYTNGDDW